VVIDDFDMNETLPGPGEADAPLIVDADRMLAATIPDNAPNRFAGGAP
jgi:hypothetical protein